MEPEIEVVPGGPGASAQVRDGLRGSIDAGELGPGDRLPTVRALANELSLAPNTVAKAYRDLESAGYVEGRGRAGTFVVDRPPPAADEPTTLLAEAADRYVARAARLGFDGNEAVRAVENARRRRRS
jgi:DNA-binding transcriptional regulator YhcF (GntR family)